MHSRPCLLSGVKSEKDRDGSCSRLTWQNSSRIRQSLTKEWAARLRERRHGLGTYRRCSDRSGRLKSGSTWRAEAVPAVAGPAGSRPCSGSGDQTGRASSDPGASRLRAASRSFGNSPSSRATRRWRGSSNEWSPGAALEGPRLDVAAAESLRIRGPDRVLAVLRPDWTACGATSWRSTTDRPGLGRWSRSPREGQTWLGPGWSSNVDRRSRTSPGPRSLVEHAVRRSPLSGRSAARPGPPSCSEAGTWPFIAEQAEGTGPDDRGPVGDPRRGRGDSRPDHAIGDPLPR